MVIGLSLNELAERSGVSSRHLSNVSRRRSHMGVKVQWRVEALLQAQAAPANKPSVDCRTLWERSRCTTEPTVFWATLAKAEGCRWLARRL